MKPGIPRGTRDFGPKTMLKRQFIIKTLSDIFKKYGYLPIETPAMEKRETLTGKYGEEGDRLIFNILNNGDFLGDLSPEMLDYKQALPHIAGKALRYDLTVPFARFVVMQQHNLTFPFKRYQIQPVWRGDRPQKGRYREFFQCDADVIGSDALLNDAELVALYAEAFQQFGFPRIHIHLNNRKVLSGIISTLGQEKNFNRICIAIDKLEKIGKIKVATELEKLKIPTKVIDQLLQLICFEEANEVKIEQLQSFIKDDTGLKGLDEIETVFSLLENYNLHSAKVIFDLQLARGLDYYTGTIYEVTTPDVEIGSLGGGGRYDNLTEIFGLKGYPGVGISFGADRIYDAMESLQLFHTINTAPVSIMFINFGAKMTSANIKAIQALREKQIAAELYPEPVKLKKQFGYADKNEVPWIAMIGEEELESNEILLKNMESGSQQKLTLEDFPEKFAKIINA